MTLHTVASNTLHTIEATPLPGGAFAVVTAGDKRPGSRVAIRGPARKWWDTEAEAWTAEAARLDREADRAAHRARAAGIEAEALTRQSQQAFARAEALRMTDNEQGRGQV